MATHSLQMDRTFLIGQFLLLVAISASSSTGTPRKTCALVHIFDDELYEEVESFELHLLLDPLVELSGVIVEPDVATVCIEVDDGKSTTWKSFLLK